MTFLRKIIKENNVRLHQSSWVRAFCETMRRKWKNFWMTVTKSLRYQRELTFSCQVQSITSCKRVHKGIGFFLESKKSMRCCQLLKCLSWRLTLKYFIRQRHWNKELFSSGTLKNLIKERFSLSVKLHKKRNNLWQLRLKILRFFCLEKLLAAFRKIQPSEIWKKKCQQFSGNTEWATFTGVIFSNYFLKMKYSDVFKMVFWRKAQT